MADFYRSPASLAPVNSPKKMAKGVQKPVGPKPVSPIGGGRTDTLLSFQAGMSVGLLTEGI